MRATIYSKTYGAEVGFPFLFGGTFIEGRLRTLTMRLFSRFPFLFGGTFIEGPLTFSLKARPAHFPSFSEGLSLRESVRPRGNVAIAAFPFLFGGTFIEGFLNAGLLQSPQFPFLFGGTFIEGFPPRFLLRFCSSFPFLFGGTFIEGGGLS